VYAVSRRLYEGGAGGSRGRRVGIYGWGLCWRFVLFLFLFLYRILSLSLSQCQAPLRRRRRLLLLNPDRFLSQLKDKEHYLWSM
jgi:hypothetical protein